MRWKALGGGITGQVARATGTACGALGAIAQACNSSIALACDSSDFIGQFLGAFLERALHGGAGTVYIRQQCGGADNQPAFEYVELQLRSLSLGFVAGRIAPVFYGVDGRCFADQSRPIKAASSSQRRD